MKPYPLLASLALAALCSTGHAAPIVVNVPGAGDSAGAQIFSYPVAVGTLVDLINPVLVDLAAGDYLLSPAVLGSTPGATFGGWNFESSAPGSWANHFVAAAPAANGQWSILLDATSLLEPTCKNHFCAWDTEAQAIQAWSQTAPFKLHLGAATTVAFASADYFLPDNIGGISFTVDRVGADDPAGTVPEPSGAALLLAAAWAARRARRR